MGKEATIAKFQAITEAALARRVRVWKRHENDGTAVAERLIHPKPPSLPHPPPPWSGVLLHSLASPHPISPAVDPLVLSPGSTLAGPGRLPQATTLLRLRKHSAMLLMVPGGRMYG
ncbi:hypothetical protein F511_41159 [Dorcoceras hygrometricum]|uniref:Uncharacterized protein n=1 Tax=Dorcoceras hygrometricum TaxID=472368 RepID=A0A2Z7CFN7_9LAMI|nr:hypothetical protein F511_41159 [Dorcoceras hygrometricum]